MFRSIALGTVLSLAFTLPAFAGNAGAAPSADRAAPVSAPLTPISMPMLPIVPSAPAPRTTGDQFVADGLAPDRRTRHYADSVIQNFPIEHPTTCYVRVYEKVGPYVLVRIVRSVTASGICRDVFVNLGVVDTSY